MEEIRIIPGMRDVTRDAGIGARPSGFAEWLHLAATPTFVAMALLTTTAGADPAHMLCSTVHGMSPLNGMVPMYLLMGAFHAAPWLKLIAAWRSCMRQHA